MAILRLAGSAVPFIFSALALAFIITSFVSKDWAHQKSYGALSQTALWDKPDFTLYRSPFVVCNASVTVTDADTGAIDSTVSCFRFKIYGKGRTSCETDAALFSQYNSTDFLNRGDSRQCQQIHYAGDLILSSLVFVCLGFALCLPLTGYAVMSAFNTKPAQGDATATEAEHHPNHHHHHHEKQAPPQAKPPLWVTVVNALFITFLSVSAVTIFLAQFYAILGLVQSSPDNGLFADRINGSPNTSGDTRHGPWTQGKGLSVYASLGWLFNALAAGVAGSGIFSAFRR